MEEYCRKNCQSYMQPRGQTDEEFFESNKECNVCSHKPDIKIEDMTLKSLLMTRLEQQKDDGVEEKEIKEMREMATMMVRVVEKVTTDILKGEIIPNIAKMLWKLKVELKNAGFSHDEAGEIINATVTAAAQTKGGKSGNKKTN